MIETMRTKYVGEGGALFKLALVTSLLTIVTLGFYRFWAKTRIRRYMWSGITIDGDRLEYLGKGLEKFLGFLIAVAFLAVYLGLFQLILSFFSLAVWDLSDNPAMLNLSLNFSFLALLPFIFYAQYRARRYMLSRTRWRGIRFGAEKAAWGYVWLGLWTSLLSVLTLGLLMPLQTFKLEKYRTDRTWFGTGQFLQEGRWTMLYQGIPHIYIGAVILGLGGALIFQGMEGLSVLCFIGGYVWLLVGIVHYRTTAWRLLAENKMLNGEVLFASEPRTGFIVGTYVVASIVIGLVLFLAVGVVALSFYLFENYIDGVLVSTENIGADIFWSFAPFVLLYLAIFAVIGALNLSLITQPILGHFVNETEVLNAHGLDRIGQRAEDDFAEADGFADALDVGAAI